jgi:predicted lipoprotein with Yx(FWY)xxD motif
MCAVFWPPAEAPEEAEGSGKFSVVIREDGSRQWAYAGMPLYGYILDEEPGDVTGDGVDDVWHVVKP